MADLDSNADLTGSQLLRRVYKTLKRKIKAKDPYVKNIKHPQMLIYAIQELQAMIGMDQLKKSISLQITYLIEALNNGSQNNSMLNTILYGPPGVGKTKVGIITAKIWYALGYLKKTNNITAQQQMPQAFNNNNMMNGMAGTILFFGAIFFIYIMQLCTFVYNRLGFYWLLGLFGAIFLIVLVLYACGYIGSSSNNSYEQELIKQSMSGQVADRDIIAVVSRRDFVADYVGQTAGKTKTLLQNNIGKVLLIDEAYSLLNDGRDPFGHEALSTLNLFMSEHPDQIVVIFAGYKDLLQNGVFKAQPGLPRRCMWHFECEGYDGRQLSEIFFRQLESKGWTVSDTEAVTELINQNAYLFPSFGGDTERLVFFSQLEASQSTFFSENHKSSQVLTPEHIYAGLCRLHKNNIHTQAEPKQNSASADLTSHHYNTNPYAEYNCLDEDNSKLDNTGLEKALRLIQSMKEHESLDTTEMPSTAPTTTIPTATIPTTIPTTTPTTTPTSRTEKRSRIPISVSMDSI